MDLILKFIPLVVVVILLSRKYHMLFAGLIGGIIAIIIGKIPLDTATGLFLDSISRMLAITIPILYAAAASMVSQAGSIESLVELAKRFLGGRVEILAGIIVLIQGLATYTSGLGAGNTMVIAPLAMSAVGPVPQMLGSLAVITTFGYTTSPASMESILVADTVATTTSNYARIMAPYTLLFFAITILNAVVGVKRSDIARTKESEASSLSNQELIKTALPFIGLLFMVILGEPFNKLVGRVIFTPVTTVLLTAVLTTIFTEFDINQTSDALVKGSTFILTTLFSVGIFLGFIELIASLGTFEEIAGLLRYMPDNLILPVALILAFLIAIPSGAYTAGVFSLLLPTLSTLGLPAKAMGFLIVATGLGAQISPVQINVAALSDGFDMTIEEVIKSNAKYIIGAFILLLSMSLFI